MAESTALSLNQLRGLKDLPAVRQLALLIGLAGAIAVGIALFSWSQQPNYMPIYPGLAEKDAAEVADALRASGVPVRLDPGSGTVTVPADKLYQARMRLASQGLPKSAASGMEMIQQEQGLGTSQFIENARYQMALETELARTISSLQPVKSARVHLALPKASPFVRTQDNAAASVTLQLYPGRQLETGQVSSIVHLVASSVPDLLPSAVTVIDQYGHLLTQADPDGALAQSAVQFDQTHRLEADYLRRIEELLSPMLGAGKVSAQVAADMDFAVTEEAHESYKPDSAVVRSEQTNEDTTRNAAGSGGPAQGIPGATSNLPPTAKPPEPVKKDAVPAVAGATPAAPTSAAAAAALADNVLSQSRSNTRNYELDRTISHTRQPVGRLKRLSVAVLIAEPVKTDPKTGKTTPAPLTPEQLAKVESLVKEAVGFDATRGDSVSVQTAAFAQADVPQVNALPLWQRPDLRDIGRQALGAIVVLVLILAVLRPLMRNLLSPARVPVRLAASGAADGGLADDRVSINRGAAVLPGIPYEQTLTTARNAVTQDPARVAQVVKTWLSEDG